MYEKKGYVGGEFGDVVGLIVGIAVAALVLVFTSTLAGTTFNLVEDDITAISNANVQTAVLNSSVSGFEAMETVGDYLPLIVLAIVIFIILGLIMGLGSPRMYAGGSL